MAIRLNKTTKIVLAIVIFVLSVALGYLIWRVNQPERLDPIDSEAAPSTNCGTAPNYSYQSTPSVVGPFPEDGEVVLYYKSLLTDQYRPILTFSHGGETRDFKMPALDSNKRAVVHTGIRVSAGDTITLEKSDDGYIHPDIRCAPEPADPPLSFGWIAPVDGKCGSGLAGPPTKGGSKPLAMVPVTEEIAWVESLGSVVVDNGSQCWADWREWPGDYDFNDYFLQISYKPEVTEKKGTPVWSITKNVVESCLNEGTANPTSTLTYTVTVKNTGNGAGTVSKIEDVLDAKVLDGFVNAGITSPGKYSNGVIVWDFTSSPLEVSAGGSEVFTYSLEIDKEHFGIYSNTVRLTPVDGDTIQANASIDASCEVSKPVTPAPTPTPAPVTPPPAATVPKTGILDSTLGRISVGITLVIFGALVYILPSGITFGSSHKFGYRKRFEKRVSRGSII